jgi:hypothetical protein
MTMLLLMVTCLGSPLKGTLVEQVVALIDKNIITQTELLIETRVALILREPLRGVTLASGDLSPDLLIGNLDYLINQHLIASQIQRLGKDSVSEERINEAYSNLWKRFPSYKAFRQFTERFGIHDQRLRSIIRREITNELYIQERMKGWIRAARVGQDSSQLAKKDLSRWLLELRKKAEIRIITQDGNLKGIASMHTKVQ